LLTDVDRRKRVTSSNTIPEVVWSRRGRHLETFYEVSHYSAVGGPIWMKFGNLMQCSTPITMIWSKSRPEEEFQYGGRLFFQTGSSYISAVDLDTSTKFGLRTDFDLRIKVTSSHTKPQPSLLLLLLLSTFVKRWIARPQKRLKWYTTSLIRRVWPDLDKIWELDSY